MSMVGRHRPESIVVHPQSNLLISVDKDRQQVRLFRTHGRFLTQWGTHGSKWGEFESPSAIAVHPSRGFYIVDTHHSVVQLVTPQGQILSGFGRHGNGIGEFHHPCAISFLPQEDLVFIADCYNHRIQVFSGRGKFIRTWGRRRTTGVAIQFLYPSQVVAHPKEDLVFVSEQETTQIQVFRRDGTLVFSWRFGVDVSNDIMTKHLTLDTNRNLLLIADQLHDQILVYRFCGEAISHFGYKDFQPGSMTFDETKNVLYVVSRLQKKVEAFSLGLETQK